MCIDKYSNYFIKIYAMSNSLGPSLPPLRAELMAHLNS